MTRLVIAGVAFTLLATGGCLAVLYQSRPQAVVPKPARMPLTLAEMDRCGTCHEGATESFLASPHRRTLSRGDDPSVVEQFLDAQERAQADGKRLPAEMEFGRDGDTLWAENTKSGRGETVDWFFGSGTRAFTPVALRKKSGKHELLELDHSLFAKAGLAATPGRSRQMMNRRDDPKDVQGDVTTGDSAGKCFGCHGAGVVADSAGSFRLEHFRPGLGCDNCHPGSREHLDTAGVSMEGLKVHDGTAAGQVLACGKCHRGPDEVPDLLDLRTAKVLPRFPPAGMSASGCYTQGRVSCTDCHDPHLGMSPPEIHQASLQACADCHGEQPDDGCAALAADYDWQPSREAYPDHPALAAALAQRDCVACHMPPVTFVENATFHDHWIRARQSDDPPIALEDPTEAPPTEAIAHPTRANSP